ncbi:efflux RND transporter periplasmic adaptor subunit [Methylobacterium nonmethylotrophicum]|uniref:efflux RND transporter periplasmic adaptor subunit n=1 Tax=Methylobacterium nonmethylotrophicum TaxID=1141884 RepID=UPI001FDFD286|nr:efflux RND transporter periplasmic adaptor subunit [Methylobacterium nonmethylotrophicum]
MLALLLLAGCHEAAPPPPAAARPVRTTLAERRSVTEHLSLTGTVRARDEVGLSFRIDGKLVERTVSPGDAVVPDQVVARLDPQVEQNALRQAEADVAVAQASFVQAQRMEARQKELLTRGYATRVVYEQAAQQLETSQAQLDAARARLRTAQGRVSYTELKADRAGIVTAKLAEPGEIVRAGQIVLQVARGGTKDAVFEVPAPMFQLRGVPENPEITIVLAENPEVTVTGRVREVAPQADLSTRTFGVKIALLAPPEAMRLGAIVRGSMNLVSPPVMKLPASALTSLGDRPAVWVVSPADGTVALRPIEVMRYDADIIVAGAGLDDGERVVTAGVHALKPGQKVRLLAAGAAPAPAPAPTSVP